MNAHRASAPIRFAAQATVVLAVIFAVFALPALLIAVNLWWVLLLIAAVLSSVVVKGRMWRP